MPFDRITVDSDQMGGLPCIRGLRVTVSMVLGQLAAGRTRDEILADYPYLKNDDITAALSYGPTDGIIGRDEIRPNESPVDW